MSAIRILQLLVCANAALLVIQSIRVIATYSAVYAVTEGPRRQLPLHVWLIATSYLIFVLGTTYFLLVSGQPNALTRVILYGAAGVVGQFSLYNVLSYERRRYSEYTRFTDPDV